MEKKYEFAKGCDYYDQVTGYALRRIRALVDIPEADVKAGELGGYVLSSLNLSHEGSCWVGFGAKVYDKARVMDNAQVTGTAIVCENACIRERAHVHGNAVVYGQAVVEENATVFGRVSVRDNARIAGRTFLQGNLKVRGSAVIQGAFQCGFNTTIAGDARISRFEDVLHIELASRGPSVTVYPGENGLLVTAGEFLGTAKEYLKREGVKARLIIGLAGLTVQMEQLDANQ